MGTSRRRTRRVQRGAKCLPNSANRSETKMKICWKTLVRYYRKNNRKTRKYVKKLRFLKKSTLWAKKYEQPGASAAPSNKSWNRKRQ
uniref:MADF domain-containing protein n=1 Tax=Steinernema glaseri TaxID=37863 RepID=A0A1I7ZIK7_9BILA